MITTIESLFSPSFLFTIWAIFLAIGLYLGVFRSMIDRIRAGISTPPGEGSRSGKLLESMLREPNHARPLHVESALFSTLQILAGLFTILVIWTGRNNELGVLVAFSIAFFAERIFSGILPRLFTSSPKNHLHLKVGFPLTVIARFLALPFCSLLQRIEKNFSDSDPNGENGESEDNEVADHIRTLSREGSNLDPDIAEIVGNTLEMGQLKVQDVMVSRKQVQILDWGDGLEKNLEIARNCGHTRLPLCEGDLDHCLGIIHVKYAFRLLGNEPDKLSLRSITKAPALVSAKDPLPLALRKMMKWKVHMALVGDEFGGIDGVITLEDILEEVVGEIQDEFDADEADVEQLNDQNWKISGLTPLHELPEALNINEEEEEVTSFGGLITQEFGKIPEPFETLRLKNLEVTILEADDTRIGLTEVRLIDPNEDAQGP
ncbi:MAG: hemolysin family protein [Opitutales bacterium]|nr:hemolysin family protein [Opitutales bacterium]